MQEVEVKFALPNKKGAGFVGKWGGKIVLPAVREAGIYMCQLVDKGNYLWVQGRRRPDPKKVVHRCLHEGYVNCTVRFINKQTVQGVFIVRTDYEDGHFTKEKVTVEQDFDLGSCKDPWHPSIYLQVLGIEESVYFSLDDVVDVPASLKEEHKRWMREEHERHLVLAREIMIEDRHYRWQWEVCRKVGENDFTAQESHGIIKAIEALRPDDFQVRYRPVTTPDMGWFEGGTSMTPYIRRRGKFDEEQNSAETLKRLDLKSRLYRVAEAYDPQDVW